jgi:hypothetical protein
MKDARTFLLRLPRFLKEAVKRLCREEGTSTNQFVAVAVAEKVSAIETARFFTDRKARVDFKVFDKTMRRRAQAMNWVTGKLKPPCDFSRA